MGRVEQPDIEDKTYTLLRFPALRGVPHSSIQLLRMEFKGINVYYPSCLNNDDLWPCRLALEGEHSLAQLVKVLQRNDFEYKVVQGKSNAPYTLW
mgnify:FL=1